MALSVKTREHIRRWAALAGPKWGALLGGAAALAAAITFTGSALHFTTVADTHGDTVRILTAATDLAAVLQQSGTPPLGAIVRLLDNDRQIGMVADDGHVWLGAVEPEQQFRVTWGDRSQTVTLITSPGPTRY